MFEGALHGQLDSASLRRLSSAMLEAAGGRAAPRPRSDPRVELVLQCVRDAGIHGESVALGELAAVACLSPGRLTHLFHEQTGLSIRRYLLWTKIRRTVQMMASDMPLTDIALAGGFTDGAHMSRTFQRCFGLTPPLPGGREPCGRVRGRWRADGMAPGAGPGKRRPARDVAAAYKRSPQFVPMLWQPPAIRCLKGPSQETKNHAHDDPWRPAAAFPVRRRKPGRLWRRWRRRR